MPTYYKDVMVAITFTLEIHRETIFSPVDFHYLLMLDDSNDPTYIKPVVCGKWAPVVT